MHRWPLDEKPLLVFWETTKACPLACIHCRANAITRPLPGELSHAEALDLIRQVAEFGRPYPVLVLTGGDPLMRSDVWELVEEARSLGIPVAMAPSPSRQLLENIDNIVREGVSAVSISIDHPDPEVHDRVRRYQGSWEAATTAVRELLRRGVSVQVNTTVMRSTVRGLPGMARLLRELGVRTWEVFYLVPVGRAGAEEDLSPAEWEDVSAFLYEVSRYGVRVRTSEGPMFRRVALLLSYASRTGAEPSGLVRTGKLYLELVDELRKLMGEPGPQALFETSGTRDGKGIIFISHDGMVYPSGFLPVPVGNVRRGRLVDIYRGSPLLRRLRAAELRGRCGACEFREVCGGSRARAFAYYGDPLAEDPACAYRPGSLRVDVKEVLSAWQR
ncbi:MAG: TIGR04053 family radical SAM/SPASM domain-containing protein [Acidilobus sp.]|nr:TIGR04053 family radical SAM/SPASM domain-containing protein [Acidilobus sp.]MCG2890103.1 TIGR04053 family radical SAM/SPASM domain-containing protein [Acidilobus sp.]MCG2891308.1 TIGR04053 family radical SAM/SPASM domain-containing protein [Acidilobus sp.]